MTQLSILEKGGSTPPKKGGPSSYNVKKSQSVKKIKKTKTDPKRYLRSTLTKTRVKQNSLSVKKVKNLSFTVKLYLDDKNGRIGDGLFVAGSNFKTIGRTVKFVKLYNYDWGEVVVLENGEAYFYDEDELLEALDSLLDPETLDQL